MRDVVMRGWMMVLGEKRVVENAWERDSAQEIEGAAGSGSEVKVWQKVANTTLVVNCLHSSSLIFIQNSGGAGVAGERAAKRMSWSRALATTGQRLRRRRKAMVVGGEGFGKETVQLAKQTKGAEQNGNVSITTI